MGAIAGTPSGRVKLVTLVILMPVGPDPVGFVERSEAEIVPRLAEL